MSPPCWWTSGWNKLRLYYLCHQSERSAASSPFALFVTSPTACHGISFCVVVSIICVIFAEISCPIRAKFLFLTNHFIFLRVKAMLWVFIFLRERFFGTRFCLACISSWRTKEWLPTRECLFAIRLRRLKWSSCAKISRVKMWWDLIQEMCVGQCV